MGNVTPEERRRRDQAVIAEYRRLRDAGDRRWLARAENGELVLYRPGEIGFARGGTARTVRSLAGLRAVAVALAVIAALALASLVVLAVAGDGPAPVFLVPAVLAGGGAAWAFSLVARERRAAALRRDRGLPAPAAHPG